MSPVTSRATEATGVLLAGGLVALLALPALLVLWRERLRLNTFYVDEPGFEPYFMNDDGIGFALPVLALLVGSAVCFLVVVVAIWQGSLWWRVVVTASAVLPLAAMTFTLRPWVGLDRDDAVALRIGFWREEVLPAAVACGVVCALALLLALVPVGSVVERVVAGLTAVTLLVVLVLQPLLVSGVVWGLTVLVAWFVVRRPGARAQRRDQAAQSSA